jgi:hypothetical protein
MVSEQGLLVFHHLQFVPARGGGEWGSSGKFELGTSGGHPPNDRQLHIPIEKSKGFVKWGIPRSYCILVR